VCVCIAMHSCCIDDNLNPMVRVAVRRCVAVCVWQCSTYSQCSTYVTHTPCNSALNMSRTRTATVLYVCHTHCNSALHMSRTRTATVLYICHTLAATVLYKCHAHTATALYIDSALHTVWRRPIGCLKLQVIFCKRATNYRALLRKMTCKDKASYDSTPHCI